MDIGKSLQEHRKNKNLTQEELAKILTMSRQTISKWETNRGFPNIENLIWLCDIYEISLDELVSRNKFFYEKEVISKQNKRKELYNMFPKYTALTVITILGLCLSFVWYGSYSLKKKWPNLRHQVFH